MRLRSLILSAALLALRFPLMADPITYTYTGNDFTTLDAQGGDPMVYTSSDFVSGEFTLSTPLVGNLPSLTAIAPTSFSFSDGVQTITNLSASSWYFDVGTDGNGAITAWYVFVTTPNGDYVDTYSASNVGDVGQYDFQVLSYYNCGWFGCSENVALSEGSNSDSPGTWTNSDAAPESQDPASTPEPGGLVLVGTGIFGLAGAVRRKFLLNS